MEIESFTKVGQVIPAIGRQIRDDPAFDVEIICGARRLFVARHLNKALLVELRELSDEEAILAMDIENHERLEISSYELGRCYRTWLRDGLFASQEEMARKLRRSPSQICRFLKVAQLPAVIIAAFETPLDIRETWGIALADAWADPTRKPRIIRAARDLAKKSPRLPAVEVYERLIGDPVKGRRASRRSHDEVVKDSDGTPLFRVTIRRRWVGILVPVEVASESVMDQLRRNVRTVLQGQGNLLKTNTVVSAKKLSTSSHLERDEQLFVRNGVA